LPPVFFSSYLSPILPPSFSLPPILGLWRSRKLPFAPPGAGRLLGIWTSRLPFPIFDPRHLHHSPHTTLCLLFARLLFLSVVLPFSCLECPKLESGKICTRPLFCIASPPMVSNDFKVPQTSCVPLRALVGLFFPPVSSSPPVYPSYCTNPPSIFFFIEFWIFPTAVAPRGGPLSGEKKHATPSCPSFATILASSVFPLGCGCFSRLLLEHQLFFFFNLVHSPIVLFVTRFDTVFLHPTTTDQTSRLCL